MTLQKGLGSFEDIEHLVLSGLHMGWTLRLLELDFQLIPAIFILWLKPIPDGVMAVEFGFPTLAIPCFGGTTQSFLGSNGKGR